MNRILNFYNFLNESKIDDTFGTDIEKSLLLFSDTIRKDFIKGGNKFPIFYPYYVDDDVFYGLSLVGPTEVGTIGGKFRDCRFTMLGKTSYKDTTEEGRRKLSYDEVANISHNKNDYYFYHLVCGDRNNTGTPNKDDPTTVIKYGDDDWYFVIKKGINCTMVKLKSRQEGGYWAEHQLIGKHGWGERHHDIKMKIMKNDILIRSNGLIKNIMQSSDDDIFSVEDDPLTFFKYDIVIDEGMPTEKRIEVKKYEHKERDILSADGESKDIMLAEQCKISDRSTLKRVIKWYGEIFPRDLEVKRLLDMDERSIHREFSLKFKEDGHWIYNPDESEITQTIRDYYNERIERLLEIFNNVNPDRWMRGVYGIYFAGPNRGDRREDFLIKIDENVSFEWKIVKEWAGFNRLKLFMKINKNAWEHILVEGNNFEETFRLRDFEYHESRRKDGIIRTPRIIYKYDPNKSLWIKEDNL